jgi:hypothetical protein
MPTINNYIKHIAAFDPETIALMGAAYDKALKSFPTSPPKNVREVIAARIISGARHGERDAENLCEIALSALRMECAR